MDYLVTWTAKYQSRIKMEPGQTLDDAITDINIPEDGVSAYIDGSWETEEVEDASGKRIPKSQYDKIVA